MERQLHAAAELARRALLSATIGAHALTSPAVTARYLRQHFLGRQSEVFAVIFLDSQHRIRGIEDVFFGTVDGTSVHPREVARRALQRNAAAVIVAHNHPSGVSEPSQADVRITERLRAALAILDIRLLDHIVVGNDTVSLAERGLL
jgi:DNA repair protein RadC